MLNYEKTKEMLDLAKKLGPEYEALVKLNINSVYGTISDNTSMHKQEMFNDHSPRRSVQYPWKTNGFLHLEDQTIRQELEDNIKCHMQNVYGIKNHKVTIDDNEVTINVHDGDYYITNVIFNDPATIIFWSDGTKTVIKCCEDDIFDEEKGLAMAVLKKLSGNNSERFHKGLKRWIVNRDIKGSLSKYDAKEEKEKEYIITCPCCNNLINIPSIYEFYKNGGNTRCAKCGLEIHMSSRMPLDSNKKEEKLCRPENIEK